MHAVLATLGNSDSLTKYRHLFITPLGYLARIICVIAFIQLMGEALQRQGRDL